MIELKLSHIGINGKDEPEALEFASMLSDLLEIEKERNSAASVFVGKSIEVVKGEGRGVHGHLAFSTPDVEKAVAYYQEKGILFDESSAKRDENGNLRVIYFKDQIAGFAIHLTRG